MVTGSGASSSSADAIVLRPHKYEVFLSFRGSDTRNGFLGHLYAALTAKGIKTYIDEKSLERGDEIAYSLVEAIHESKASVVVLSESYASSWWCLDELVQILQCRERIGQIVVPIFYHVEPTHVRKQQGKFGEAFSKLKLSKRFKDDEEKLNSWTTALSRVTDLFGWDTSVIRSEAEMLDGIVKDVKRKLERKSKPSKEAKSLVGIEERVEKIKSLLCISNQDALTIGIWGMGGIGKTTLAKEVFNDLYFEFEGRCFLENVRKDWENGREEKLRNKLHSKLLDEENPYNSEERLANMKVMIVLDDVNDQDQLEFLIKDCSQFGNGSRVIVTTRDKQMLRYLEADDALYEVKVLNQHEALKLFLMNAFRSKSQREMDTEISTRAVNYAQGVPLAIKVLGSYLRCREKENWGTEMDKLEQTPHDKIQNVLKLSYSGLDETNKKIFLDIACFFNGYERNGIEAVLDGCGFYAKAGIDDLVDKSLVAIRDTSRLWMHDLIQEMGVEIVNSTQKLENRSRLWIDIDVVHVLKNNIGSKAIEGLFLDTAKIGELDLSHVVFKQMPNLRLLNIEDNGKPKLHFPRGLQDLPDELRYLIWTHFPMKSLPPKFTPHNLVELDMPNSQLRELWNGVQDLANLKHIDLSFSENLTTIPDLSLAPNLETVYLHRCTSLVQIPALSFRTPEQRASKGYFSQSLLKVSATLHLRGCSSLKALPKISGHVASLDLGNTKVGELSSTTNEDLIFMDLSPSSSFNKFQIELPRNIVNLNLSGTVIDYLPSSVEHVSDTLEELHLRNCKKLGSLPTNLYKFKKLMRLDLYGCSNLEEFPEKLPPTLEYLDASRCTSLARVSNSETLAQAHWRDYHYKSWKKFLFCECLKLNDDARQNILIEYQIRILRTATMSMVHRQKDSDVNICIPGSDIPQWFNCRSEERSITINLPENWHSTDFIGFALCVSATFQESKFNLNCTYYYRNINNSQSRKLWHIVLRNNPENKYRNNAVLESDHVFMWYMGKNHHRYLDAVKITFELRFTDYYDLYSPCKNKVNRCGVRVLNWEDAEKFGISKEAELNSCDSITELDNNSDVESESDSEETWYESDAIASVKFL